jgi:hypothetical protein
MNDAEKGKCKRNAQKNVHGAQIFVHFFENVGIYSMTGKGLS